MPFVSPNDRAAVDRAFKRAMSDAGGLRDIVDWSFTDAINFAGSSSMVDAFTIMGNNTASPAAYMGLTVTQVQTLLGYVSASGTPAATQLAIWSDAASAHGDSNLTWATSSSTLTISGTVETANALSIPAGSYISLGNNVYIYGQAGGAFSVAGPVSTSGGIRAFGAFATVGNTQDFITLGSGSFFRTTGDTNNIAIGGGATDVSPSITITGSDTNIGLAIALKGTGNGGVVITGPGSTNLALSIPSQSVLDLSGGSGLCRLNYGFDGNCGINTGLDLFGGVLLNGSGAKVDIIDDSSSTSSIGQAQLASGAATVSTTAVAAGSRIFLTHAGTGTAANFGTPYVGTITAGVSFVIHSTNASDNDKINWWIIS